ncbi:hypothetical protein LG047_03520 [Methylocystis sp. WRRC1]|uniref:hypothetical protein n=1 Tax=unclassified Methylocystis TaxID=2625913 RepID=UPI0001F87E87|nr:MULTISPECIES: hypothetical protein [unclassified Methylocystis]MCC3244401.1 hypothetical protein [Methylocystis sp. WRRC1]
MPRLGLSISESFDARRKVSKPDRFGRRVRHVNGVYHVGEKPERPLFGPLFLKLAFALSIIAMLAMSLAMWRLFHFPH